MAEYIEREAFLKDVEESMKSRGMSFTIGRILQRFIEGQPAADVVEVRRGEWNECDWVEYDGHSECVHYPKAALCCSECRHAFKKELLWKDNFCPNCGANLVKKENNE